MKKGNKILAGILMCGVLATGAGMLAGCGGSNNDNMTTTDIYGFAGVTTAVLANDKMISEQMVGANANAETSLNDQLSDTISNTLDKYMSVFDSIMGGKKPVNVVENDVEEDLASVYDHKLTISTSYIDGNSAVYEMYFNETLMNDNNHKVHDSDREERETKLSGVMYIDGDHTNTLYIEGKKEIEAGEMEIEFSASIYQSGTERERNKVVFKQEVEREHGEVEEEYMFDIYVDGQVSNFEFGLEKNRRGEVEVEYSQTIGSTQVNFEIEKERNRIVLETMDFFGVELKLDVSTEVNPDVANQVRYVYTVGRDGGNGLVGRTFYGAWRNVD